MSRRVNSKWLTRKETPIYCIDFSSLEKDIEGLKAEMQVAEAVIENQPENSLLLAVDLRQTAMSPELAAFFNRHAAPAHNPIRKMAILGISGLRRLWYGWTQGITWPRNAAYFEDYEKAKDWMVSEQM